MGAEREGKEEESAGKERGRGGRVPWHYPVDSSDGGGILGAFLF